MSDTATAGFLMQVFSCKCKACGNHWTASSLIMKTNDGGYTYEFSQSIFAEILKKPALVEGMHHFESEHPACFRCVGLGLNQGWQTPSKYKEDFKLDPELYDKDGFRKRTPRAKPTGNRRLDNGLKKYNLLDD